MTRYNEDMTFGEFSKTLQRIEETTLRNEMMEILSELFKNASVDEISQVVYLSLGGLRPKFDRLEFNLAEKMVIRAVARAFGKSNEEVMAEYKKLGDMGIVASQLMNREILRRQATNSRLTAQDDSTDVKSLSVESNVEEVTVRGVYEKLETIAREEGQRSQERKVEGLSKLLGELDSLSVRYVTRMVVGKLRLGFSDKTILDALSFMENGNKEGRKDLDYSYQVSPDIGNIAKLVKEVGIAKVASSVKVTYGVPVVPALAQRLKTADEMIEKMGEVMLESKYDGTRVQIHYRKTQNSKVKSQNVESLFEVDERRNFEVRTFTRNLDENSFMFPELQKIPEQIKASEVILDSEAIGYDPKTGDLLPFQMTITRKRKHGIGEATKTVPLKFFVFDILYIDGESWIDKPLIERRKKLEEVILKGEVLIVDNYEVASDPKEVRRFHQEKLDMGHEGAMVKQIDGVYSPGRTGFNWVKFKEVEEASGKLSDTIDGVVMGYYRGRGKRTGFGIGAFLIGVTDKTGKIVTLAKIGTGLSDDQWREIKERILSMEVDTIPKEYGEVGKTLIPDVWVEPKLVVEVAADELTTSKTHSAGVALRFPRLVKFRDDKSVGEITTVEELGRI